MTNPAHADLIDRLGRDRVAVGEVARRMVGLDGDSTAGPLAVVRPGHADHMEQIIRVARQRHVPLEICAQLPVLQPEELRDMLVVDTTGLNRPPAIDVARRVVTVGAGVEIAAVDRAARQARLCLRGLPTQLLAQTIGAQLAVGEPGELGLGDGSLLADVVGAQIVTGGGRTLHVGGTEMLGQPPWLGEGLASPLPLLLASEGKLAVLCEVSLRLQPAAHISWSQAKFKSDRAQLLGVMSAARQVLAARLVDSILLTEEKGVLYVLVRAATWRGQDDLPTVTERIRAEFKRAAAPLPAFVAEDPRIRLGQKPRDSTLSTLPAAAALDLRLAWPDVSSLLDVTDALYGQAEQPPQRQWALHTDFMRLRCGLPAPRPDLHPLMQRFSALLDAGAVPIWQGSRLRAITRERMAPAAKVLMTALARAWDPEGVLGA